MSLDDAGSIQINHLCKTIGAAHILSDITMRLTPGTIYGVRGPNGAGKTMLMRAICGLIRATSGSITIDGQVIGRDIQFPRELGALIENPAFLNYATAFENLRLLSMIRRVAGRSQIEEALSRVGLDPADPRPFRKYSLGMKRRLGVAAALFECPHLLVLDEPSNGLDVAGVAQLRDVFQRERNRGALLLISSHDTAELDYLADQIICLENGVLVGVEIPAYSVSDGEKK